jgi:hypothetical protein
LWAWSEPRWRGLRAHLLSGRVLRVMPCTPAITRVSAMGLRYRFLWEPGRPDTLPSGPPFPHRSPSTRAAFPPSAHLPQSCQRPRAGNSGSAPNPGRRRSELSPAAPRLCPSLGALQRGSHNPSLDLDPEPTPTCRVSHLQETRLPEGSGAGREAWLTPAVTSTQK